MKRKIILNLAMSLDGYILDDKGKFDWVKGDGDKSNDTEKQFSFPDFISGLDIMVMGKKSYQDCTTEAMEMFKSTKIYVASSEKLETKYDNIKFIEGDVVSQIVKLKEEDGKNIWLFGGAVLADQFIKADVIDEYIVGIIPIILGSGKPLFLKDNPTIKLHFKECTVQEGVTISRYTKRN